jgi:hypothetical protein
MKGLSESDIRDFATSYRRFRAAPVDGTELLYSVAIEVLANLIAPEWVGANVLVGNGPDYLRPQNAMAADGYKHLDRTVALADMLFNLQTVEGADARFQQLRTRELEACIAELEAAKLIHSSGHALRFVDDSGATEPIYDVETTLCGHATKCETKCKLEATDLGAQTIIYTLNAARRQLPKAGIGLIFVKIPEHWVRNEEAAQTILGTLVQFFRNTKRISAVIFHWEEWYPRKPRGFLRVSRFRVEHNSNAAVQLNECSQFIKPRDGSWRHIAAVLKTSMEFGQ